MSRARDLADGTFSGAFSADSPTLVVDDANNRVGVGTASPSAPLQIAADSNALSLRISGRSSGDRSDIEFYENDNTTKLTSLTNEQTYSLWSYGTRSIYTDSDTHIFRNGSATTLARIDGDGLKFNGDTAAANALDDYEFGSWSPYWSDASGNTIFNASPTVNMARYEKIGNMVTCWTYFNMGSGFGTTGSYSAGGTLYVSGLPFTADGDGSGGSANYYAGSVGWYNSWTNYDSAGNGYGPMCYTVTGTTRLILEYPNTNNSNAITQALVNNNNSGIIFNIVYQTSA